MNTPLVFIKDKLPPEIINIIQSYVMNENVYLMLQEYFGYLQYKEYIYDNFVYDNYIIPNCYCINDMEIPNCQVCINYEQSDEYTPSPYLTCIKYNDQYLKILIESEKLLTSNSKYTT